MFTCSYMYVIPMSLLSMLPFCTTLYDAPYKFKSRLSLSVLSKDSFFVSNFFCICTILWQDDDIFIFL